MCLLKGLISCKGLGANNAFFSVNHELTVGQALFIISLKARHPAPFQPYKELSKYLWDWICIYPRTIPIFFLDLLFQRLHLLVWLAAGIGEENLFL